MTIEASFELGHEEAVRPFEAGPDLGARRIVRVAKRAEALGKREAACSVITLSREPGSALRPLRERTRDVLLGNR